MASKVLKNFTTETESIDLIEFAASELGQEDYDLKSFVAEEEHSVQDTFTAAEDENPEAIPIPEDIITDDDYLPPSRRLAKAEEDIEVEAVETWDGSSKFEFEESPNFSDALENEQEYPQKIFGADSVETKPIDEEIVKDYESKIALAETNNHELEAKLTELQEQFDKLSVEHNALVESEPAKLEEAKKAGYDEGYEVAKTDCNTAYEASKDDYMAKLDEFNNTSIATLNRLEETINDFDSNLGGIVLGFVESIIGEERKLNDEFVIGLIKKHMSKLVGLKDVSFAVNPEDIEVVKNAFPDHVVSTDTALVKGSVRITSNIGDVNLNPDELIKELAIQINTVFENNKSNGNNE